MWLLYFYGTYIQGKLGAVTEGERDNKEANAIGIYASNILKYNAYTFIF